MKQTSHLTFIAALALAGLAGFGCASTAPPANRPTLKVVKVDSEEIQDGSGTNAVDGNPDTFWSTQWRDSNPPCPHEITIELIPKTRINGFSYLPRQDGNVNGTIKAYAFYVSNDGADFGQPVSTGTFENSKDLKTVTFLPVKCRFIRLKALSEVNGQTWTTAAEIGVIPND